MMNIENDKKTLNAAKKYAQAKEAHSLLIECMNLTDSQKSVLHSSYVYLEELHAEMLTEKQ